jgi:hypothetical protein
MTLETAKANKPNAGTGSNGICRVIDASRSPSPDPKRSLQGLTPSRVLWRIIQ